MSKQSEIGKVDEQFELWVKAKSAITLGQWLNEAGIGTKDRFECDTCKGEGLGSSIEPIDYKE